MARATSGAVADAAADAAHRRTGAQPPSAWRTCRAG